MTDVLQAPTIETGRRERFEFTYSSPQQKLLARTAIRLVESLTGQPKLKRLYRSWQGAPSDGTNVFSAGLELLGVKIAFAGAPLSSMPTKGPLLVIANHPYGVLDGLAIGKITTAVRSDVKIMTNALLCRVPEAAPYMLPVDFAPSSEARAKSAMTRRAAQEWLKDGHCVVVFPSGSVATSQKPLRGKALEPSWHPFIGKLATLPGVRVQPVYFHGQNSRLFQIASHLHYALRLSLLFRETAKRMGSTLRVTLGELVKAEDIRNQAGRAELSQFLRTKTLALGGAEAPDPMLEFKWPKHIRFD